MAEKITPEKSQDTIKDLKVKIASLIGNDFIQKAIEYAPMILDYAEKYAMSSETEVDDRAVVIAEAVALILNGGIKELLDKWSK